MDYNSAAAISPAPKPAEARLVIGPNASLSAPQAWRFMGLTGALAAGIAVWFASHGLWPVIPFAGLELLALGLALRVALARNAYREVLVFGERTVRVEFGTLGRGVQTVVELSRSPTRVLLEPGQNRHQPTQLLLSCAGQRVRIGRCLTDGERARLAARIKQLLTPGWCGAPDPDGAKRLDEEWPFGDR